MVIDMAQISWENRKLPPMEGVGGESQMLWRENVGFRHINPFCDRSTISNPNVPPCAKYVHTRALQSLDIRLQSSHFENTLIKHFGVGKGAILHPLSCHFLQNTEDEEEKGNITILRTYEEKRGNYIDKIKPLVRF